MSEVRISMDFRHSITVWFPNSSDFGHFREMSEIQTYSLVFRQIGVSDIPTHKGLDFRQVWISDKFGFQTITAQKVI